MKHNLIIMVLLALLLFATGQLGLSADRKGLSIISRLIKYNKTRILIDPTFQLHDMPERDLTLKFVDTTTLVIHNSPKSKRHKSLCFYDKYRCHLGNNGCNRIAVIDSLLETSRAQNDDCALIPPFRPYPPKVKCTTSIMPFLTGDTVIIGYDAKHIVVGGLIFGDPQQE